MSKADYYVAAGAALNDTDLRRKVDAACSRRFMNGLQAHYEAMRGLLARYPWQEYPYKVGRWQRGTGSLFERWWDYGVWERCSPEIQLLDATTGTPSGELWAKLEASLPKPKGRLWLAGDPRLVVAYTPAGDGKRSIGLAVSSSGLGVNAMEQARSLHTEQPLPEPVRPYHYQEKFPYGRSTWLADRPRRPSRRDGFKW